MKKNEEDILEIVDGMYRLKSPEYAFIKGGVNKRAKIVLRSCIRPYDKVIFCDRCKTIPAIQLDSQYMKNVHFFTVCIHCLHDIEEKE